MKHVRETIKTCNHTKCVNKLCPNHTQIVRKDSVSFPDCYYNPAFKRKGAVA